MILYHICKIVLDVLIKQKKKNKKPKKQKTPKHLPGNQAEKKENGKEVFIPPITIASIYELTGDKIENDYRNNTDLPFVAVECQLKINNAYTGTKLGWLIKSFSDKMFGDSTSGLRSYSKAIKTSLIIDDSVRYEVAEIRNPELRIDNSRNIISTNENEYRFIIILRPVKRRIK